MMTSTKILCVDDEIDNVEALERIFRKSYSVLTATSGSQALELLKEHEVAVIISDQRMPQMKGVEFLEKSIASHPDAIRILLTGYTDIQSVIEAINTGQVYRYINKPWEIHDLQSTVARAVERYHIQRELKQKKEDLEKAYQELKTLDEAKSHFMLLIHHELKTPLTTISSFMQLLNQSALDTEQALYCEKIKSGVTRLNELILSVLQIMEAETGRLKIFKREIELKPLLQDIVQQLKPLAEDKQQTFQICTDVPIVYADQSMLNKVLKKLLHNAVKFGNEATTITVGSYQKDKQVEISITNSAPELSQQVIEQILKPFVLNEDSMHHSQGLGLGLNFCQALLKRHGSELKISSQDNTVVARFLL